ncbi:MAG: preprotein translocase subunit SecA [Planctomycetes bacterium]|nr:preprotein translocase subunit SecA [Planctomycetota bacterium]
MAMEDVTEFVGNMIGTLFGSRSGKILKRLAPRVERMNALEAGLAKLTDRQLREKTEAYRNQIAALRAKDPKADENGRIAKFLEEIQVEAFALVREAGKRTLGMRHFDVQLMGGMVLHEGMISEMVTGEGKTLVASLPCYLNSLPRRPEEYAYVHVITVNDYLAKRDSDWNRPLFEILGMTVGAIQASMDSFERHPIYACDIVYGTNSEFGFDYLRDNMKMEPERQVQKVRHFAIVDEVDSELIDEARTPLIISGSPDKEVNERYMTAAKLVAHLKPVPEDEVDRVMNLRLQQVFEEPKIGHYIVDEKDHTVTLTEEGIREAERYLGISNYYAGVHMEWPHFIDNALKAKELYKKGKNYEVTDDPKENKLTVVITDEFTGRPMFGRRWADGLHQAVEAKEILAGEKIQMEAETQTLATITIQNFFKLYKKLGGMTGTAVTEAREFGKIYRLEVAQIPTNRPMRRMNYPDVIYGSEREKWDAICQEIEDIHATGRPILVGTTSVEKSEMLAGMLERRGYKGRFEVLNAKREHIAREAGIVAKAGQLGAITVATNMAGRGTDILLGRFSIEQLLEHWQACKQNGKPLAPKDFGLNRSKEEMEQHLVGYWAKLFLDEKVYADTPVEKRREALEKHWQQSGRTPLRLTENVRELGGLHIIGSERHESRRIDNQLRGRSGRQGDPGSSRFFLSLDDDLMRIFAKDWVRNFLRASGMKDGVPLESRMVSRSIENAQRRVEEHHFGSRKRLLEYDEVMNEQRKLVYDLRQKILEYRELQETMNAWLEDVIALAVERTCTEEPPKADAVRDLTLWAKRKFTIDLSIDNLNGRSSKEIEEALFKKVMELYAKRETELGDVGVPSYKLISYSPEELKLGGEERVVMVKLKLAQATGMELDKVEVNREYIAEGKLPTNVEVIRHERKMRLLERFLMLDIIDSKWKDHLHNMDVLRDGIYLRGYAQKDPKLEYKREGFDLFLEMFNSMKEQAADLVFRMQVSEEVEKQEVASVWNEDQAQATHAEAKSAFEGQPAGAPGGSAEMAAQSEHGGSDVKAVSTIRNTGKKIGPNEPCPCGSGKKFKKCHGMFGDTYDGPTATDVPGRRGQAEHKGHAKLGG